MQMVDTKIQYEYTRIVLYCNCIERRENAPQPSAQQMPQRRDAPSQTRARSLREETMLALDEYEAKRNDNDKDNDMDKFTRTVRVYSIQ